MKTQQIPTVAQLSAARMARWHQAVAAGDEAAAVEEQVGGLAGKAEGHELAASAATEEVLRESGAEQGSAEEHDGESADETGAELGGEELGGEELGGEELAGEELAGTDMGDEVKDLGDDSDEDGEADLDEDSDEDEDADLGDDSDEDEDFDEDVDGDVEGDDAEDEDGDDEDAAGDGAEEGAEERSLAVHTMEAARELIERCGLMLFAPQPAMMHVPAPTLVEATMGEAKAAPTMADGSTARSLLARMVAEGSAVPLNLLGAPTTTGETPDFVASASAFSYVFTLRGDKNWKQMPEAMGPHKVSPLAVNTYGLLVENGPQTASTLVTELGKGLTESAVLRALGELWQQMRVIPVAQANGKPTMWEPIASRLLRQVKQGANAGVPTALSALISLYLQQAILATEDEVETFLSPLSPRSKVRDVVHGLMAAQQLETMTIEGKHHVFISGELPEFAGAAESAGVSAAERGPRLAEDGSRIRRMVRSSAPGSDRAKPFRSGGAGGFRKGPGAGGFRKGPGAGRFAKGPGGQGMGDREGGRPARFDRPARFERSDRPVRFARPDRSDRSDRPARFDRPWEERGSRPQQDAGAGEGRPERPRREGFAPRGDRRAGAGFQGGDRPAFRRGGDRPAFGRSEGGRPDFGRPRFPRPEGEGSGEGRTFADRPRREFSGGGGADRPWKRREGGAEGGDRPSRPFQPRDRESGGFAGRKPFRRDDRAAAGGFARRDGDEGSESRPKFRRFDAPDRGARPFRPKRTEGGEGRPAEDRAAGARPWKPRFDEGGADRRPARGGFAGRERQGDTGSGEGGFAGPRGPKSFGGGAGKGFGGGKSFGAGKGFGGGKSFGAAGAGGKRFGDKEGGSGTGFAGKKFGGAKGFQGRAGGDRPAGPSAGRPGSDRMQGREPGAGPFDKFKGGNKPWGKRPPARKFRGEGGGA